MEPGAVSSICLEWFKAVAAFVTSLAWPLAIVALAWLFRTEIGKKLSDVLEAGVTGVKFRLQHAEVVTASSASPLNTAPLSEITPFQTKIRAAFTRDLERIEEAKRIPTLLDALTVEREFRIFEGINSAIFGSQVRALEALANAGGNLETERVIDIFNQMKASDPSYYETANFAEWSRFLVVHNLIDVGANLISLTDAGRDFVTFIREHKKGQVRRN